MAKIKSFTDIEQSKVLAEILPLESADGFWEYHYKWYSEWEGYEDYPRAEPYLYYTSKENEWKEDKSDVPCWSLAAMLSVLPYPSLHKTFSGWRCDSYDKEGKTCKLGENADNPIDACYEMIIKLHEKE